MSAVLTPLIGVVVAVLLILAGGPYGIALVLAVVFVMVCSIYQRSKQIQEDVQAIKEKLKIREVNPFNMSNEDIEKELEQALVEQPEPLKGESNDPS